MHVHTYIKFGLACIPNSYLAKTFDTVWIDGLHKLKLLNFSSWARFMLERAVCGTERGETEHGTAFVFTL